MSVERHIRSPIDVLVCVHNSPEDVRLCLTSARDTLGPGDRLVVVDDGSAEETRLICEEIAGSCPDRVRLIRRPEGSGFCRAANAGLAETSAGTVVILNSDTIVVGDWLDRLHDCLHANWQIGICGPLSNAGGWQSIPAYDTGGPARNAVKDDAESLLAMHQFCNGLRESFDYPFVEQLNGFCFALRREVLETVGTFDEQSFPRGYGEESDLVLRALGTGFLCAVAVDCFVYHAKTKSYSTEARAELGKAALARLYEMHGKEQVQRAVQSTQQNPIMVAVRERARAAFASNGWLKQEHDA